MAKKQASSSRTARPRNVVGQKKKTAKKAAAGAPAIKKSKGAAKIDPNQDQLPGFEEDRVPAIEKIIKNHSSRVSQIAALKEADTVDVGKLPDLFKKHKLQQYAAAGFKVTVSHGADQVKFKKVDVK